MPKLTNSAKALSFLFTDPSLKSDGNEVSHAFFIAVGFSRRIKGYQNRALAKFCRLFILKIKSLTTICVATNFQILSL
jgi:hypothetical protein